MVTVVFVIWIFDPYQAVRFVPTRHCIFAERHCQVQCELARIVYHDIKRRKGMFAHSLLFEPSSLGRMHERGVWVLLSAVLLFPF